MDHDQTYLRAISQKFALEGDYSEAVRWDIGHINDTYVVSLNGRSGRQRVLLQRINHNVFQDVPKLMDNYHRVTTFLFNQGVQNGGGHGMVTPQLHSTVGGCSCYRAPEGSYWRCSSFIESTYTVDVVEHNWQAREAARAYGTFQKRLLDFPAPRLHETIPQFHDTPTRFRAFVDAFSTDPLGRSEDCREEIKFALAREPLTNRITDALASGSIPERITHNDTKINNVLFDERTDGAVCVVDLDTVMPGSILYDFGDMVRTTAGEFAESERDLSRVKLLPDRFEAMVQGYLTSADFLVAAERELLTFAGRLITLEQGIRFLTDYLLGDRYYRTHFPHENLVRARTQLRFVREMEDNSTLMDRIVSRCV